MRELEGHLFSVAPGQDPYKVRDVQCGWEEHEGYSAGGIGAEADQWIVRVVELSDVAGAEAGGPFEAIDRSELMQQGIDVTILMNAGGPAS